MTTTNIDTAAAETIRTFALANNEPAFAHLVTAALNGEEWAIERVAGTLASASQMEGFDLRALTANFLAFIWQTDTTRPDGAIARRIEV